MKFLLIPAAFALTVVLAACSKPSTMEDLQPAIQSAIQSEDYPAAESLLSSVIDDNPDALSAITSRAAVRVFLGDAKGVREDFEAAVRIDAKVGENMQSYIADRSIWRARELSTNERHTDALKIYDVLLTLYPESGMVYHDRGGLKTSMGDHEGAIADLTRAIEFDSGNNGAGDSFTLRARAKRAAGDEAGAVADEARAKEGVLKKRRD